MIATVANMRKVQDTGAIAYSPTTGEEYSANPADYWDMNDDTSLKDETGEPMILVRRVSYLEAIEEEAIKQPPRNYVWESDET